MLWARSAAAILRMPERGECKRGAGEREKATGAPGSSVKTRPSENDTRAP